MRQSRKEQSPWRAAGMLGVVGVDIAACTVLGYFIGRFLSNRYGGNGWMLGGVLLGLLVGIITVVLMVRRFLEGYDE